MIDKASGGTRNAFFTFLVNTLKPKKNNFFFGLPVILRVDLLDSELLIKLMGRSIFCSGFKRKERCILEVLFLSVHCVEGFHVLYLLVLCISRYLILR